MTYYAETQEDKQIRRILLTIAGISLIAGSTILYNWETGAEPEKIEVYPGAWVQHYPDKDVYSYADELFVCVAPRKDPMNFYCIVEPTTQSNDGELK